MIDIAINLVLRKIRLSQALCLVTREYFHLKHKGQHCLA